MPRRKTPADPPPFRPNGFLVCYHGTGEPAAFIACDAPYGSHERDRIEGGLLHKVYWERFYVVDLAPELREDG